VALAIPESARRSWHLFAFAERTVFAPWIYPGAEQSLREMLIKYKEMEEMTCRLPDLVCELNIGFKINKFTPHLKQTPCKVPSLRLCTPLRLRYLGF
jgi:hypothetical protein